MIEILALNRTHSPGTSNAQRYPMRLPLTDLLPHFTPQRKRSSQGIHSSLHRPEFNFSITDNDTKLIKVKLLAPNDSKTKRLLF